jgi:hypothetical protein
LTLVSDGYPWRRLLLRVKAGKLFEVLVLHRSALLNGKTPMIPAASAGVKPGNPQPEKTKKYALLQLGAPIAVALRSGGDRPTAPR